MSNGYFDITGVGKRTPVRGVSERIRGECCQEHITRPGGGCRTRDSRLRTHSEPAFGASRRIPYRSPPTGRCWPGLKRRVRETSEVEPRINVNIWVDLAKPADWDPQVFRPIFHPTYGRDSRGRSGTVSDCSPR